MKNILLQDNLKKNNVRFYQQQLFDRTKPLKKAMCYLALLMFVCDIIETQLVFPKDLTDSDHNFTRYVKVFGYSASFLCYYISIFKIFESNKRSVFRIRYFFIFLSVLLFSMGQFFDSYYKYLVRIQADADDKWIYTIIRAKNDVWVILFMDILIPIWYLKLIVPTISWMSLIIAYLKGGFKNTYVIWVTFAFCTAYLTCIWGVKAYTSWKAFLTNSNSEAWNGVHKYILDKFPDPIAIIDSESTVLYSNLNFEALCENDVNKLSERVTNVKKAQATSQGNITINQETTTLRSKPEDTKTSPELPLTFSKLLEDIMDSIKQGTTKSDDYIVFDAKISSTNALATSQLRSYEIKIGPLLEHGKAILVLTDVTQRDLAISLQAANLYKDKLLATVSHDLRAPIMGSLIFIENSIQHNSVPDFIKEQNLIPAQKSCKFLLHLVNDILDFAQINAKKLRLSFENSSLIETIRNCHQLIEMQATKKGLSLVIELDYCLPDKFITDHNRLSQILINLLTNAIKFTLQGEIRISATALSRSLVEIKVSDTGIGIKPEDQSKLFQEFARIEYDQKDINTRGIGLGLVIANQFAKKLGLKEQKHGISFISTYGKGTTFSFVIENKIPQIRKGSKNSESFQKDKSVDISCILNISDKEEDFLCHKIDESESVRHSHRQPYVKNETLKLLSNINSEISSPAFEDKKRIRDKILIVDDNPLNVLAFESILNAYGIPNDSAYNGEQAILKVLHDDAVKDSEDLSTVLLQYTKNNSSPNHQFSNYKMILMDYEMPGMNGIEATKKLTVMMQNNEIKWIPIIGCSGHTEQEFIEECKKSGMAEVISKPPKREELIDIIEKYYGPV